MNDFELICGEGSTKFLRARYANLLLFVGAIFAAIVWEFLLEIDVGREGVIIASSSVFLVFVWYYSTFVSRISEVDGSIHVLKAFTAIQIPVSSITSIRVSSIRMSYFAKITIEQDDARSIRLRLISPATNIGTFRSTILALEQFAQRHRN